MNILLEKVNKDQKQVLGNLLEFYVYEFSDYLNIDFNEDGKYGFDPLESYFSNEKYYPYFIKHGTQLVGFVIVKEEDHLLQSYCIEQFFVAKKFTEKGIGKMAAKMAFDIHRGSWKVTQIEKNYPAQAFWRSTINEYTHGKYSEKYDDQRRSVQEFDNSFLERFS